MLFRSDVDRWWLDFADDPRVLAKSTSKAESAIASLDRTIGRDRGIRGVVNPALITGSSPLRGWDWRSGLGVLWPGRVEVLDDCGGRRPLISKDLDLYLQPPTNTHSPTLNSEEPV